MLVPKQTDQVQIVAVKGNHLKQSVGKDDPEQAVVHTRLEKTIACNTVPTSFSKLKIIHFLLKKILLLYNASSRISTIQVGRSFFGINIILIAAVSSRKKYSVVLMR